MGDIIKTNKTIIGAALAKAASSIGRQASETTPEWFAKIRGRSSYLSQNAALACDSQRGLAVIQCASHIRPARSYPSIRIGGRCAKEFGAAPLLFQ